VAGRGTVLDAILAVIAFLLIPPSPDGRELTSSLALTAIPVRVSA